MNWEFEKDVKVWREREIKDGENERKREDIKISSF